MSVNTQKYIIQSMERCMFFDLSTGACEFIIDDIQTATMTNAQETVYATGKNGVKIGSADRNKESSIEITNGTVVDGMVAAQTGADVVTEKCVVPGYMEVLTVSDDSGQQIATTSFKAIGPTGTEITYIYKRNVDGTCGTKYPIAATATVTAFSYDPDTRKITCPTGIFKAGDELVVFYNIEVNDVKRISNIENKYSKTGKLVVDIFAKDSCTDKSYYGKIVYYKAKAEGNFDLTFNNDPSVPVIKFNALSGACNTGVSRILWDLFIFDEDDIEKAA